MLGGTEGVFHRSIIGEPLALIMPTWLRWRPPNRTGKAKQQVYLPEKIQLLSQKMAVLEHAGLTQSAVIFSSVTMPAEEGFIPAGCRYQGGQPTGQVGAVAAAHLKEASSLFRGTDCFTTLDLLQGCE